MYIDISQNVYDDTKIDKFMNSLLILQGSKDIMNNIIQNPIYDKELLMNRQIAIKNCPDYEKGLYILAEYENDIEWALNLSSNIDSDEDKATLFEMLYPMDWYNKFLNYNDEVLTCYHGYKIYLSPLFALSTPITVFLTPFLFLKSTLNISFSTYVRTLKEFLMLSFKSTFSLTTLVTYIIYILLYFYGLYQQTSLCWTLHKARLNLFQRVEGVAKFIRTAKEIFNNIQDIWSPFKEFSVNRLNNLSLDAGNLSDVFSLWQDKHFINEIKIARDMVYILDVVNTCNNLYKNTNWCMVKYLGKNGITKFTHMKNPLLDHTQVGNPVLLGKNYIVTAANASGKTTYVKSIVCNYILAQTIGLCMAKSANIQIVECIATFMRLNDIVGTCSFFEIEANYCKMMLEKAEKFKNTNALFVLDEPLHGTPPTEGAAMAYAFCEYLALNYSKSIRFIVTSHYHSLTELVKLYPNLFMNLSMDVIQLDKYEFKFPYKIQNKPSFQSIAIELLGKREFPEELIESAINFKNKLVDM